VLKPMQCWPRPPANVTEIHIYIYIYIFNVYNIVDICNIFITYNFYIYSNDEPMSPEEFQHFPTFGQVAVHNVLLLDWHSWTQDSRGAEGQRSRRGEQPRVTDEAHWDC